MEEEKLQVDDQMMTREEALDYFVRVDPKELSEKLVASHCFNVEKAISLLLDEVTGDGVHRFIERITKVLAVLMGAHLEEVDLDALPPSTIGADCAGVQGRI